MSRIYSATNKTSGNEVTLYRNDVKDCYEVVVKGSTITSYISRSLAEAYRDYNLALR